MGARIDLRHRDAAHRLHRTRTLGLGGFDGGVGKHGRRIEDRLAGLAQHGGGHRLGAQGTGDIDRGDHRGRPDRKGSGGRQAAGMVAGGHGCGKGCRHRRRNVRGGIEIHVAEFGRGRRCGLRRWGAGVQPEHAVEERKGVVGGRRRRPRDIRSGLNHGNNDRRSLDRTLGNARHRYFVDQARVARRRRGLDRVGGDIAGVLGVVDLIRAGGEHDLRTVLAGLVGGKRFGIAGQGAAIGGKVKRAAARENADQLLARHARPHADAAGVHVDKRRAGGRIVADAADLHAEADFAEFRQRNAGNVEVHRLAEHVLAVLGDGLGAAAQHGVGVRRAIAADNVDWARGARRLIDLPEQVEQVRVHLLDLVLPPIADEVVQPLQPGLVVNAIALEDDRVGLSGMDVIDFQGPDAIGDGIAVAKREGRKQHGGGSKAQIGRPARFARCPIPVPEKFAPSEQYAARLPCPSQRSGSPERILRPLG